MCNLDQPEGSSRGERPSKMVRHGWNVGISQEGGMSKGRLGKGLARADLSLTWMALHPTAGFSVSGQLIGDKSRSHGQHEGTYIGRLCAPPRPAQPWHLLREDPGSEVARR